MKPRVQNTSILQTGPQENSFPLGSSGATSQRPGTNFVLLSKNPSCLWLPAFSASVLHQLWRKLSIQKPNNQGCFCGDNASWHRSHKSSHRREPQLLRLGHEKSLGGSTVRTKGEMGESRTENAPRLERKKWPKKERRQTPQRTDKMVPHTLHPSNPYPRAPEQKRTHVSLGPEIRLLIKLAVTAKIK